MSGVSIASFSDLYPTHTGTETSNKVVTDDSDSDMISGTDSETVEITSGQKKPRIIATIIIIICAIIFMAAFSK